MNQFQKNFAIGTGISAATGLITAYGQHLVSLDAFPWLRPPEMPNAVSSVAFPWADPNFTPYS